MRPHGTSTLHRVVVYYQSQNDSKTYCSPTPLISVATHLIIAALHLDDDKIIHINNASPDDPTYTQLWKDVARMQGSGVKVMVMLGGEAKGSYKNLSTDFETYYQKLLLPFIQDHRLDGIDLDIEESEKLEDIGKLIQSLRGDLGEDFIITLTPVAKALCGETDPFSGFDYRDLEKQYGEHIDWYNAQFYSGLGTMANTSDYNAIIKDFPLDSSRIVAIMLTNPENGSGFVDLEEVKKTVKLLLKKYGHLFGGVAGWEYYNSLPDKAKPWSWAAVMKLVMGNSKEVAIE
ncbi:glycoside hydrolase family 18 protein [Rhodocollybia butyracea]|uniref:chitinase n=1 Tax=Rhodocollybia butyracea TaxID=206335 RepID=A0A9P5Q0K6_9AGAR|nr:glycoside hydrolase family 18 protein [Rhodocollybia butyracea]